MPDRIRLDGRVAVVTGAAGVIGTATMQLLAERGAHIVAVDREPKEWQAAHDLPDLPQPIFFTMGKLLLQANVAADEIGAWLKARN